MMACNDIDQADRYIEVEAVTPVRAVLLEDFTGQRCTNCPDAHRIIDKLKEQYGDALIPVAIHGGSLSIAPGDAFNGLRTDEGDEYYKNAGQPDLPAGRIDRGRVIDRKEWSTVVRSELTKEAPAAIEIAAAIGADGKIAVDLTLKAVKTLRANLQLWVLEDGIVAYQYDDGKHVPKYTHNHVFRGTVNGLDGDPVNLEANVFQTKTYTCAVADGWNKANLSVVAFIYNDDGVQQAALAKVVGE